MMKLILKIPVLISVFTLQAALAQNSTSRGSLTPTSNSAIKFYPDEQIKARIKHLGYDQILGAIRHQLSASTYGNVAAAERSVLLRTLNIQALSCSGVNEVETYSNQGSPAFSCTVVVKLTNGTLHVAAVAGDFTSVQNPIDLQNAIIIR